MASPIHAPDGSVLGAIDLSTSVSHGKPERLLVVAHVAHVVEQALAQREALRTAREAVERETVARGLAEDSGRALRESEERFRRIFEDAPIGMALVTPDFKLSRVNRAFASMLGYAAGELVGRSFVEITHPDDVERDAVLASRLFRGEIPSYTLEKRYRTRSGGIVWVSLTGTVFRDADGSVVLGFAMIENVTAERQTRERLRESHALLRGILEGSADGIFLRDLQGRHLIANPAACRALGKAEHEVIGRTCAEILPPENAERIRLQDLQVIAAGRPMSFENELVMDGVTSTFLVLKAPYRDADERVAGVIGVARDISERREAERRIQRLNAEAMSTHKQAIDRLAAGAPVRELLHHLCRAVETARQDLRASVLIHDQGRLRHATAPSLPEEYCREVDGLEVGEAQGSCGTAAFRRATVVVADIAHDPLWSRYRRLGEKYGLGACWSTPLLSRRGDVLGTFAVYSREPHVPSDEELRRTEAFAQIAAVAIERERSESAREAVERRLRAVSNQTLGFLGILTPEGTLVDTNDTSLKVIGLPREAVLGRPFWEIEWWDRSPEVQAQLKADVLQAARGIPVRRESTYFTDTGETRTVDRSLSPVRDAEGRVDFVVAEGRDITDRHRAEEEVRQANERLEEHARQLQESLREMEAFSYTIAHDLRTPLRAMAGYSEILLEDIPPAALSDEVRGVLRKIFDAAKRMDLLVLDLLAYNGLTRTSVAIERVDTEAVVTKVVESMEGEIRALSAEVIRAGPFPPVVGHPTLLNQALTNLISNAIKFVAPGVVPRVTLRAERTAGKVRLWVEDNGIGIDSRYHGRIFGVFERLNRTEDYPGTGIGLAIVTRAMEKMGGRVGLESSPGCGSRFWIELPEA